MEIKFSFNSAYGTFSDCLFFTDTETPPTELEIEKLKEERFSAWIKLVTTEVPVPTEVPTFEDPPTL